MRLVFPVTALLLFAACEGSDSVAEPCVMELQLTAPEPVRVGGTRIVEADLNERSGNCSDIDTDLTWRSSQVDVIDVTTTTETSATIVARRVGSSTITAWMARTPAVRDSVTIPVGPLVDN